MIVKIHEREYQSFRKMGVEFCELEKEGLNHTIDLKKEDYSLLADLGLEMEIKKEEVKKSYKLHELTPEIISKIKRGVQSNESILHSNKYGK